MSNRTDQQEALASAQVSITFRQALDGFWHIDATLSQESTPGNCNNLVGILSASMGVRHKELKNGATGDFANGICTCLPKKFMLRYVGHLSSCIFINKIYIYSNHRGRKLSYLLLGKVLEFIDRHITGTELVFMVPGLDEMGGAPTVRVLQQHWYKFGLRREAAMGLPGIQINRLPLYARTVGSRWPAGSWMASATPSVTEEV